MLKFFLSLVGHLRCCRITLEETSWLAHRDHPLLTRPISIATNLGKMKSNLYLVLRSAVKYLTTFQFVR